MKENMGMTQKKTSQNIRKEDERSAIRFPMAPYGRHMEVFGLLMRCLWPPLVLYGPLTGHQCIPSVPYGTVLPHMAPSGLHMAPEGPSRTLMDSIGVLLALIYTFGPYLAPYTNKVGYNG